MKARAKSFTIWSDNTRQPVVRMKRNPTPEGGDVVPPTKKKRTYGMRMPNGKCGAEKHYFNRELLIGF